MGPHSVGEKLVRVPLWVRSTQVPSFGRASKRNRERTTPAGQAGLDGSVARSADFPRAKIWRVIGTLHWGTKGFGAVGHPKWA